MSIRTHALDVGTDQAQFFLKPFIAAVEVINTLHLRFAFGDKTGDDQAHRGTQVGGHHGGVVLRQGFAEEEAEHAAFAVGAERHACGLRGALQTVGQRSRALRQRLEEPGLGNLVQRRPSGASCDITSFVPPKAASGMPPPMTLPKTLTSGLKPGISFA